MGCGASASDRAICGPAMQPTPILAAANVPADGRPSATPARPRIPSPVVTQHTPSFGAGRHVHNDPEPADPDDVSRAVARMQRDLLAATADVEDDVLQQRTPVSGHLAPHSSDGGGSPADQPAVVRCGEVVVQRSAGRNPATGRGGGGEVIADGRSNTSPRDKLESGRGNTNGSAAAAGVQRGGGPARPQLAAPFRFDDTKFRQVNREARRRRARALTLARP